MAAGNASNAYVTDRPIQESLADTVGQQEQANFNYRAEQRTIDEINRLAKDREAKRQQDLIDDYKPIKSANATGIKSYDDFAQSILYQAMDKHAEIAKKKLAGVKLTPDEVVMDKNLELIPDQIDFGGKSYLATKNKYEEEVKAGSRKRDPDYELATLKIANNAVPFLDRQGKINIGIDKDGDGKPDIYSLDLNQGFNLQPKNIPNVSKEKLLEGFSKIVEPTTVVNDQNYVKTKKEGIPFDVANTFAHGAVYNKDGTPSNYAISSAWDAGIKDPTKIPDKFLSDLEADMTKSALNVKKTDNERSVNYGAVNANKNLAERKREFDLKQKASSEKDKKPPLDFNEISNTSVIAKSGNDGDLRGGIVGAKGYVIPGGNLVRKIGSKGTEEQVKTFYLLPNGGVALYGDKVDGKIKDDDSGSTTNNITPFLYKSTTNAGEVADFITKETNPETKEKFKTVDEFENLMRKKINDGKGNADPLGILN